MNRMNRTLCVVAMSSAFASAALQAVIVGEMTPETVRSAIAEGVAAKEAPRYEIRKGGFVGSAYKPVLGVFSTPYLRVAQGAREAKLAYRDFTPADVTPEMTAPEAQVFGFAQANGTQVANVKQILLTKKGARGPGAAIRPDRSEPIPVGFKNLYGLSTSGESMLAVFPLAAFQDGYELHIIYDGQVHDGAESKYCEDCIVELDLKKVK